MSRSPTTRPGADYRVGAIEPAFGQFWLPHEPWQVGRRSAAGDGSTVPKINWQAIFGNANPIELEIGFGRGMFLRKQSQACPEINFVGIEWSWKFTTIAAQRIAESNVGNLRIFSCDARRLTPSFPDRSFQAIHVYFPDPWWKRKHRKKRMIDAANVAEFARLLVPGGRLLLATDVAEYFQQMQKTVAACGWFQRLDPEIWPGVQPLADPLTHFAKKYAEQGRVQFHVGYKMHYEQISRIGWP